MSTKIMVIFLSAKVKTKPPMSSESESQIGRFLHLAVVVVVVRMAVSGEVHRGAEQ